MNTFLLFSGLIMLFTVLLSLTLTFSVNVAFCNQMSTFLCQNHRGSIEKLDSKLP